MARYRLDPQASRVWIDARSSLHPIHSETSGVEGWLDVDLDTDGRVDADRPASGHVELRSGSLSSGNGLYDRELHRRIDVRRHPTISGDLAEMKETPTADRYRVEGDVTFRGERRRMADEMTIAVGSTGSVRLEGTHTFDIREFGMEPPRILTLRVFPDVVVRVDLVGRAEGGG